jgi:hypothetical protein
MRSPIDPAPLQVFLHRETIATLHQLKHALNTTSTMTVFRKVYTTSPFSKSDIASEGFTSIIRPKKVERSRP